MIRQRLDSVDRKASCKCNASIKTDRPYTAKSEKQSTYINLLESARPSIVVAHGPAGTGKTKLAVQVGMWKLFNKEVDKIVLTRPTVPVDNEQHGFLPGTLNDKMRPWLLPIEDAIRDSPNYKHTTLNKLILDGRIEIAPLGFMRGRTFHRSWVICDEAQNCTPSQILMILTRAGKDTKIVISGDTSQNDRGRQTDGLSDLIDKLNGFPAGIDASHYNTFGRVDFENVDVQRSQTVRDVLDLYSFYSTGFTM
jgi:phosphate starvation-inducible PhoH-like protein